MESESINITICIRTVIIVGLYILILFDQDYALGSTGIDNRKSLINVLSCGLISSRSLKVSAILLFGTWNTY